MSDDKPLDLSIPEQWPPELVEERMVYWSMVNWSVGIRVGPPPEGSTEVDFLGMKVTLVPRVPVAGERLSFQRGYLTVDHVTWSDDGRVSVRLNNISATPEEIDEIRALGWTVVPRHNTEQFFS